MMTTIRAMSTTTRTIEENRKKVDERPNPFNTWFGASPTSSSPSTQSSSGVSSSNTFCHNSPVPRIKLSDHFAPQPNHRPNFISDEYLRLMQQDISFYQSLRTDQCWIRLRKNLEDQQILGFIEWMNHQFSSSSSSLSSFRSFWVDSDIADVVKYPIRSLSDLHDGLPLIFLLECLYKCAPLKKELKCRMRLHKVKNFETCLSFMRVSRHCECVGIQAYDLADCVNVKIMLGFLFLIKHDYEYKYLSEIAADDDNHVDTVVTASANTVDTVDTAAAGVEMMNASLLSDEIKDSSVSVEEEVDEDESDHSHYHLDDHVNDQHVDEPCIQTESDKNEEMSTMTSSVNEMSSGLNMGLEHDESGIMTIGTCTASNVTMTAVDGNDMSFEDSSSSTSSTSSSVFSLTSETLPTSSSILLDAQKEPNNDDENNNTNNKDLTSTYSSVIETYDMSSESSNELDYDEDDRDRAVTPVLVDQENNKEEEETASTSSTDNRPRLSSFTIDSFLDDEHEKTNIESTEKNDQEQDTNSKEEPIEKTDIVEVVEASNYEPSELEIVKTPIDLEQSNDDNKELVELVEISSSSLNNVDEPAGELLELEEASAKEEFVSEELIEEVVVSDILPISQHLQVEDVVVEPIECAKVVEITLNGSDIKVETTASNETDIELSRPEPARREPVEIERLTNGDNSFKSTTESNGSVIRIPLNVTKRGDKKPQPPHHKTLKMSLEVKAVEKPAQKVAANVETESSKVQISKPNVEVVNKEVVVEKVEKIEKKKEIEPTEKQPTKTKNLVKNGGPKIAEAPILPSSIMKKPPPPSDDDKLEQQKNGGEKIPKIKKDADNKKEKTVEKNINTNQTVEKKANKKKVAFASVATSSKKEEENHSSNHNGNSQTNGKMNGHSEKKEKVGVESKSKSKSTAIISKYWKPSSILIAALIAAIYYFINTQD